MSIIIKAVVPIVLPEEIETFVRLVMKEEAMRGWRVSFWGSEDEGITDGECVHASKLIFTSVLHDNDESKILFLHEVAHALDERIMRLTHLLPARTPVWMLCLFREVLARMMNRRWLKQRHDKHFMNKQAMLVRKYFKDSSIKQKLLLFALDLGKY